MYYSGDIDVDINEVFDDMTLEERRQFISEVLEEEDSKYVPEGWFQKEKPVRLAIEDDAVYRLEVITWLRENGWTVEPIG